ncbi:hypothetical protein DCAR_0102826 [Daucus carota subsp. sativus]|uniref:Protein transport protein Sec24-like At3g07100 n=1 Tax=Daucus carota subsp. sativus TaxID=79200 RepID=A0AAF0W756_DAUCS|nr:PREDICTED: protein transport protein Sec24-like At3g07100 [Daucus carota subsp. sativus]XP_017227951.1 PREDICTED: protein transport protein Sec24-like At3g07100 [Daucus carota subsp. sativus]WOG83649.1 hypothetical protein DCAR_0102826 [Daucus carota subsp. sativus]
MGTEDPSRKNFPYRPAASPFSSPQSTMPFLSSPPVVGSQGPIGGSNSSSVRPSTTPASQTSPFISSRPAVGPEPSNFRPGPPVRSTTPFMNPSQPSYSQTPAGPFQRAPGQQFPSNTQVPPPRTSPMGQQASPMPTNHSAASYTSMPALQNPNYQSSAESSYFARPNLQQSSPSMRPYFAPGTQPNAAAQTAPVPSASFLNHQNNYVQPPPVAPTPFISPQHGYAPPPPGATLGPYSMDKIRAPSSTASLGPAQGLAEDFNSLSIGSVPGSFDPGLDSKALPRPLDGDLEPKSYAEMYPLNCNSRYLRLATSAIPNSQSLASRWHLPLGAVVCPLAEAPTGEEVPIVNFATTGIVRCKRCRTYINPYVTFTDGGRKWQCNICTLLNEVPGDYFAPLDAGGRRIDLDKRPELVKGSVEFVAPTEYMVRPPMPPLYFFLIDVSISAVRSGVIEVVAQTIKSCLDTLPGYPRTQIGFITFDSTIQFYNMKSSLTQPQMMVVSDLEDIFVPLPDDLLVNLSESRSVVDAFLDSLPSMFQDNVNVESAFGPALKAAYMIMNQLGGKLLIFQNTLPSLGVGRLRLRGDDLRAYGTDKEHALRTPEDPFYKQMAAEFTKYQIAVNIYAFSDKYTDIASIGTLAKYTGGQVYYYPNFQATIHKERLQHELARDLTRETAWEAVLRIRCGRGVRFTSYHGNFMLRSTDLLALPAVDCDKAYAMQLCLEETLLTTQTVYFQVALLYTSSSGERRIRVHTAAAPVVADLGEMYRQADTGAIISLLGRLAIEKSLTSKLEDARNSIQLRIVKALKEYRNLYAVQHRVGSRMIYPESLKFLPLYGLALYKSTALRGGYADAQLDERCAAGFTMMALPVKKLLKLLYPNLIRIDECLLKADALESTWKKVPLAADSLDPTGLYVYDDGFRFVVWFGRQLLPDIARNLLGEDYTTDYSRVSLYEHDNAMSRKLMKILKTFRETDPSYYQLCHLVRQGEQPREGFFLLVNLVEDQVGGMNSYLDWILQIHRQIQQNA